MQEVQNDFGNLSPPTDVHSNDICMEWDDNQSEKNQKKSQQL